MATVVTKNSVDGAGDVLGACHHADDVDDVLPLLIVDASVSTWARVDVVLAHTQTSARARPWPTPPLCVDNRSFEPSVYSRL
ncbi:hypothetical protein psal_cds_847 [Pandoravirus salinus]|uniref:Uncharacterized protein n=1 Tax=Pandoravirus salinus TaxID=1349410 RepID=S4VW77_9VIRU|nr:hypothetical protein psal_cds_847 [Pandoravirus salinus]AGO84899.1 hypothetical protein psal_cds_847 [Pandoravirus salinus]